MRLLRSVVPTHGGHEGRACSLGGRALRVPREAFGVLPRDRSSPSGEVCGAFDLVSLFNISQNQTSQTVEMSGVSV